MIRAQAHKKGKPMKTTISKISMIVGALALALTASTNVALAQSGYPPAKLLAAQWWQWALAEPALVNPLSDTTGQYAAVNQRGRVWFVAGSFSSTPITRTFTVPAGKALFFPIVNVVAVEDGIGKGGVFVFPPPNHPVPQPVQTAQAVVSSIIATATGLSCEVDGIPLPITSANLEQSTPFSTFLPENNILGVPAGVYFPFVDSGYYVLLAPLSSGFHTIHFAGTIEAFSLSIDVTDNITVQ
jgi:hypothetical protein